MRIINVHTHIFNFACVPNGFLSNFIGKAAAQVVGRLLRVTWLRKPIGWLLERFPFTRKFAAFVQVGTSKTQDLIFAELASHYPPDTAFVVLTMDFEHMAAGDSPANFATQLRQIQDVKRKYPDTCLPFLGIDPRKGSAAALLAFVRQYFDPISPSGFVGLKLYPSLGFYPFHPSLELVYAFAEQHGIPIMTHCTRSGVHYVKEPMDAAMVQPISFNPTEATDELRRTGYYAYDPKKDKNKDFCDKFLEPVNYLDVLHRFPDLKLCLAHLGGDDEMPADGTGWYGTIKKHLLTPAHPNVRVDVSYTLANDATWPMINADLASAAYGDRILFGTDFFMTLKEPFTEHELWSRFMAALAPGTWERIAYTGPKAYLTSPFHAIA